MKKFLCILMIMILSASVFACRQEEKNNNSNLDDKTQTDSSITSGFDETNSYDEPEDTYNEEEKDYTAGSTPSLTKLPKITHYTDRLDNSLKGKRSLLNSTEKELYDKFLPYVLSYTPFTIDYREMKNYNMETLSKAIRAICWDYPETWLYFTSGSNYGTIIVDGERHSGYISYGSHYFYRKWSDEGITNFSKEKIDAYITRIDDACNSILSPMPNNLTVKDKYIWIANRLCEITEYDDSGNDDYIYADGPLLYGKGICQSYSFAYQWLCQKAGLWCIPCDGWAADEGHCWNVVKLQDGKTYYMDITWADGAKNPNDQYFMTYSELVASSRVPDEGEWIADG